MQRTSVQIIIRRFFVLVILGYQHILSPLLPPACRFFPSCSEYTRQAIIKFGLIKGCRLGLQRLCRCHPLHPGGIDPVP